MFITMVAIRQALLIVVAAGMLVSAAFLLGGTKVSDPSPTNRPIHGVDHGLYEHLLESYVSSQGWVDYDGLAHDRHMLNSYLDELASAELPRFPGDSDRLAFWINAYNAYTLQAVLDHVYGKANGVRQVPGFFDRMRYRVAGQELTLNEIEQKARAFRDPRVHFALVCASTSCPKLQRFAYTGPELQRQLDLAAREFLGDPNRGLRLDTSRNTVYLSSIFMWYAGDFTGMPSGVGQWWARARAIVSGGGLLNYVDQYAPPAAARFLRQRRPEVKYLRYDWTLNSTANHSSAGPTK